MKWREKTFEVIPKYDEKVRVLKRRGRPGKKTPYKGPRIVVAYGAALFSASCKRNPPVPVILFRRILRHRTDVYDLKKDYTSQLCNGCYKKFDREMNAVYSVRC